MQVVAPFQLQQNGSIIPPMDKQVTLRPQKSMDMEINSPRNYPCSIPQETSEKITGGRKE